jgi:hypothetical protein
MKPTIFLAASLLMASAAPVLAQQTTAAPVDTMAVGRQATMYFYAGQLDSLWAMVDSTWQQELGSSDWFIQRAFEVQQRVGEEEELVREEIRMRNGEPQYWRTARFSGYAAEPVVLRWVVTPEGKVSGVGFNPESRNPPTDDEKP